jgi:hypothetical protein
VLPERLPDRRELETPYRRPLRYVARTVWRGQRRLRINTGVTLVVTVAGVVGAVAVSPLLWLLAGAGVLLGGPTLLAWAWVIVDQWLRLRRAWRQKSTLRAVREARPQAGSEDPDVLHHQYAVTAEDDGYLITWRFRALEVGEPPDEDEVEVPGRPRWGAKAISDLRFDWQDAARAAEQLVDAQEEAAARELRAAARAGHGETDAERRAELAAEARSTAAALQRATGQRGRRD